VNEARDHRRRRSSVAPAPAAACDTVSRATAVDYEVQDILALLPERQRLGLFLLDYGTIAARDVAVLVMAPAFAFVHELRGRFAPRKPRVRLAAELHGPHGARGRPELGGLGVVTRITFVRPG
jgi:hypothetical protein